MVSIVASQAIDPGSIPGWRRNSLGHDATNGPGVIMDKEEKCDLPSREWRGFESRSCLREIFNFSCNQRQRKIAPNFGIKSGLGHCKNTYEKSASAGNRTRIYCLEGNNANLYTTDAIHFSECYKVAYSINTGSLTPSVSDISGQRSLCRVTILWPSGQRHGLPFGRSWFDTPRWQFSYCRTHWWNSIWKCFLSANIDSTRWMRKKYVESR